MIRYFLCVLCGSAVIAVSYLNRRADRQRQTLFAYTHAKILLHILHLLSHLLNFCFRINNPVRYAGITGF